MAYQSPFSTRYGSPEMRAIWSEVAKRRAWRSVWAAVAEAQSAADLVSPEQMNEINTIEYANRRKMKDIQAGKYTEVTQETAREMVLTEKMKSWLQESYGR